jgi:type IV pilus assembly protein PilY1
MNRNTLFAVLTALVGLAAPLAADAQASIGEDFTGNTTTNSWYFFNGACLTAGNAVGIEPSASGVGQVPGCKAIGQGGSGPLYYNQPLVGGYNGVAGNTQTLADPVGHGALRFTNGSPGGYSQNGAIVSTTPFSTGQGVAVTFKTVTYRGDSGGIGAGFSYNDGADGLSFYLLDASQLNPLTITGAALGDGNGIGSWGGSLGYTCSNANPPYNGLVGAYLGLGIDEYGNFLNGVNLMPGYTAAGGTNTPSGDNSALGYGRHPNRIGLRGAGNIAWNWLNANYPLVYPSTLVGTGKWQAAVKQTCQNGELWDTVNNRAVDANDHKVDATHAAVPLYDYAPIPGAYAELPATSKIANESAMKRGDATTIFYQLRISQNGLLSLSYSTGGAYQPVITKQSITAANGALPANLLFGFAGSTGGSTNIHEILCFKADPATTAASSAGASEKQSAKIETGTQAYFAYYNPSGFTGRVTATGLGTDAFGDVVLAATPNWDASCVLTGVAAGKTCTSTLAAGPIVAEAPASRVILSWNGSSGIPFEWANLTTAPAGGQQAVIDAGDATPFTAKRVQYLRGDRTNEVNSSGVGLFRSRTSVLADVIDSSPTWVGPPNATFPALWSDRINPAALLPENSAGAQNYPTYVSAAQTRTNVVYVGGNDGLVHGFRSGSFDATHTYVATGNDGTEVLAYMPGAVVQSIHSTTANVDFANTQYGHNFSVDATPGTGDVFYKNQWHTWLVGGLGPGGSAIYALDVTTPTAANFAESNAANLVMGEWTPATITCSNVAACGKNMGNTYGSPQLRRLHDGKWAAIFGNGFGSTSGDAGIYVMTIDPSTAATTTYYLSTATGSAASPNGIAYASAADLDGDHITDYVYAGDLQGNLWRFDLTSSSETNWAVSPGPLFKTPAGQPITTAIVAGAASPSAGMAQQVMILFGTGQKMPLTNSSPPTFSSGTQSLYGVWDWNLTAWNANGSVQYAALTAANTGLTSTNDTMVQANLQAQTVTVNAATQDREILANATICWANPTSCTGANAKFGWYLNFPGSAEQVIYSPGLVQQALTVNTLIPAPVDPTSCTSSVDTGFTYVLNALTGGAFFQVFLPPGAASNPAYNTNPKYTDTAAIGTQTNAAGSSFDVRNAAGTNFLVFETTTPGCTGTNCQPLPTNIPTNSTGRRISWIERR